MLCAHREGAAAVVSELGDESPVPLALARSLAAIEHRSPFHDHLSRLRSVVVELDELVADIRTAGEGIEDDPNRLAEVTARRQLLTELKRKYGDTIAELLAFQADAEQRLSELRSFDARAAELDERRRAAIEALAAASAALRSERERVAPDLAAAVQANVVKLAMPSATIAFSVDGPAGDEVTMLLAPNPGSVLLPLAKVASGGELARTMLALRNVLTEAPPTLVFDEVDAGIGGEAAHAVGSALGELGDTHQVLVVTHLAQVAAYADHQFAVTKSDDGVTTSSTVVALSNSERVVELSRMLSGSPDSGAARDHASELMATASLARGR